MCACRDQALINALIAIGMPVASGPPEMTRMLLQHSVERPVLLCPATLRNFMRDGRGMHAVGRDSQKQHAAALLAYCLQDIDITDPDSCMELEGRSPRLIAQSSNQRCSFVFYLLELCNGRCRFLRKLVLAWR